MLKDLLESKKCFKLICGAGNEDVKEVGKLVALYSKAGCRFFDLSANEDVIDAAKKGLEYSNVKDASLCVSFGIKGDPHVNKAKVDYDKCISCYSCDSACKYGAIKYAKVKREKCLGCGKCAKVCPKGAISFDCVEKNISEVLPKLVEKGIDCVELHSTSPDGIFEKWEQISKCFDGMLSFCTSRRQMSDEKFIEVVKELIKSRKPYTTIIQADGFPMSGGRDDYKTTLQAVAIGEIVQNEKLPVYLMLSGGTNSKTLELAHMCGIEPDGVSIGSYARKIVKQYIDRDDFLINQDVFGKALSIAKSIVF